MLANAIIETTTTTGTGDLTTSAVTGRPRFTDKFTSNSTEASADHFYYAILTQDATPQFIESGIGYMSATGTLKRSVVLSTYASSTYTDVSATAISLASGTKNVICTGECGAAGGLALPGVDTSNSALRWISSNHVGSIVYGGTLTMTANRLYMQPFLYAGSKSVDALAFRNSTGTGNVRIGLYTCNRDGTVGRKIMGSTADTATAAGTTYTITTGGPIRLTPGWYYMGIVCDAANVLNVTQAATTVQSNPLGYDGVQYPFVYGYLANGSTTLPDPCGALTTKVTNSLGALGLHLRMVA